MFFAFSAASEARTVFSTSATASSSLVPPPHAPPTRASDTATVANLEPLNPRSFMFQSLPTGTPDDGVIPLKRILSTAAQMYRAS